MSPHHQCSCPAPREPTMPLNMWLHMFNNYLLEINAKGSAWPDAQRRATLLHCLGAKGQRIFYALTDPGETYDTSIAALKKKKKKKFPKLMLSWSSIHSGKEFKPRMKAYSNIIHNQLLEHLQSDDFRETVTLLHLARQNSLGIWGLLCLYCTFIKEHKQVCRMHQQLPHFLFWIKGLLCWAWT